MTPPPPINPFKHLHSNAYDSRCNAPPFYRWEMETLEGKYPYNMPVAPNIMHFYIDNPIFTNLPNSLVKCDLIL